MKSRNAEIQRKHAVHAPVLTPNVLADATIAIRRMSLAEKVQLCDEIHLHQPNLLMSVLTLKRSAEANFQQIEPLLETLLVIWQAMKASGHRWPLITEQLQDDCLQRLVAKMRFSQGLAAPMLEQALQQHIDAHPEPFLLALMHDELRKQGWHQITDRAVKHVVLAALNLVECVAAASPPQATKIK